VHGTAFAVRLGATSCSIGETLGAATVLNTDWMRIVLQAALDAVAVVHRDRSVSSLLLLTHPRGLCAVVYSACAVGEPTCGHRPSAIRLCCLAVGWQRMGRIQTCLQGHLGALHQATRPVPRVCHEPPPVCTQPARSLAPPSQSPRGSVLAAKRCGEPVHSSQCVPAMLRRACNVRSEPCCCPRE
jgi:hypothetical protein